MSEATLASAVAVPDQDNISQSPTYSAKRRKSSVTDHETKRPRLSGQDDLSPHSARQRLSPSNAELAPADDQSVEKKPARKGGKEEDRKRGQRLFGALLGTLSQSSNSVAQKRRADIEKRQQDKLKTQANEYDGLKKKRRDRRDLIRRKEKPFFEREAMQTRHANMISAANFLKTRTKPVLYFKPWQHRPGDEAIIQNQIKEAEETVSREVADFEARFPPEAFIPEVIEPASAPKDAPEEQSQQAQGQSEDTHDKPRNLDSEEHPKQSENPEGEVGVSNEDVESTSVDKVNSEPTTGGDDAEQHDAHHDDGGEVVEDNEDTVIY